SDRPGVLAAGLRPPTRHPHPLHRQQPGLRRARVAGLPQRAGGAALIRWILRRLGAALLVMWGAATATFLAVQAVPGDVVDALLGPGTVASPELRAQVAADIGVDRPLAEQYLVRMGHLLIG